VPFVKVKGDSDVGFEELKYRCLYVQEAKYQKHRGAVGGPSEHKIQQGRSAKKSDEDRGTTGAAIPAPSKTAFSGG